MAQSITALDLSNSTFAMLLELAESKFYKWRSKELQPEWYRRVAELKKQNLTFGGRAIHTMRIYREMLELEARSRVGFYSEVARQSSNTEMLSNVRLEEYRQRVMASVGATCGGLKDNFERAARAAGDVSPSALPIEHRYVQLQAEILDVVNTELRVLQAEGKLAGQSAIQTNREKPLNGSSPTYASVRMEEDQPKVKTKPVYPLRATWLADRMLERGWSTSDPSMHHGPDRKTVEKILRGEAVRNDVLDKLAQSLSAKFKK